jgi:hypothetical protein
MLRRPALPDADRAFDNVAGLLEALRQESALGA